MERKTKATPLTDIEIAEVPFGKERRRRLRVSIRCEVRFCAGAETLVSTVTENLSCEGFYCLSNQPLAAGTHRCTIVLPAHMADDPRQALYLECDVQVMRVEERPGKQFGIAARIRSYQMVAPARLAQNGIRQ